MTEAARQQLSPEQLAEAEETAQRLFEGATRPQDRTYVVVDGEKIPQLSKKRKKRIRFALDEDVFEAYPSLDVFTAMEFMDKSETWQIAEDAEDAKRILRELFALCLQPESYERFVARLQDRNNPVDVQELPEIVVYLFEEFGLRPTRPSSDSSGSPESQDGGTRSTDEPSLPASTSTTLTSTGS